MQLHSLQTGKAANVAAQGSDAWWDKEWHTSFFKQSSPDRHWLGYEGLRGDEQADRKNHGGVDRAVCVYAGEHYPWWRETLSLAALPFGAFGENFTTTGLLESTVCVGDLFTLGSALLQVSQPRQPCWKLGRRWQIKDLAAQVERTGLTGYYFRVLKHGHVVAGDVFAHEERPFPAWTIQRCHEIMYHQKDDLDAAQALSQCPALSGVWKDSLWARVAAGGNHG
jgi:MOSC domain-containing protein YiiM